MDPNRTLDILCAEIGFQYQVEKILFSKTNFSLRKRNSRSCCDRILVAGSLCVVPIEIHRIIIVVGLELVNTLKSALTD